MTRGQAKEEELAVWLHRAILMLPFIGRGTSSNFLTALKGLPALHAFS